MSGVGVACRGCMHAGWNGAGGRAQEYPECGWPTDEDGRRWGLVDGDWYCPDDCERLAAQGFIIER